MLLLFLAGILDDTADGFVIDGSGNPATANLPSVTGAALGAQVTSPVLIATGVNVTMGIVPGPGLSYSLGSNNPVFTTNPGTIAPDQRFRVRAMAAATPATLATYSLDLGDSSFSWAITTAGAQGEIKPLLRPMLRPMLRRLLRPIAQT